MDHPQKREAAANPTHSNIDAIAALEHDALAAELPPSALAMQSRKLSAMLDSSLRNWH
jgi:hypothetical protein